MTAKTISEYLRDLANPTIAKHSLRFFKTGKGDYGEGDRFLGLRVPVLRACAKKYKDIELEEIQKLLESAFHEERLCALLILVYKFPQSSAILKTEIYRLYLNNTQYINNWDLVDCSAHYIIGPYLIGKSRMPLYKLVKSKSLWERRIAIMATFHFIKNNNFEETLKLSELLLNDKEDLIHKAVGWMLREVGNRDHKAEVKFLKKHYTQMPRTMLRYAIEKFPESERQKYLKGTV